MKTFFSLPLLCLSLGISNVIFSQTNVFDDVIAPSPNHSYLEAALIQEGLDAALQNPSGTFTVFAPDNTAFDNLAAALGTDINGLLALPDLDQVLLYHVLGTSAPSASLNNGDIVTPLNPANTLKLTVTSGGSVYANQAMVNAANLSTDNGIVHSVDAVLLPVETVVDIAIDNGFTSLSAAVIEAELLPALTDPFSSLTVFAPTNQAFDDLATALGTDINGLLALPNLAEVLTYHVLGSEVESADVSNGLIATPLNAANTLKFTVTGSSNVYVNQAQVTAVDLTADNGTVHVLDAVVLPSETVVDVAIDNGFTSLTAAVVQAELLPALTDPFSSLTVFAPSNQAFDDLAVALGTDLNGVLNSPNLTEILLYHVVDGAALSTDLVDGPLATLNGQTVQISTSGMVMVNTAMVTLADVTTDNGVVHAIDEVLVPSFASLEESSSASIDLYPNPANNWISVKTNEIAEVTIFDQLGQVVLEHTTEHGELIDISNLVAGTYIVSLKSANAAQSKSLVIVK